MAYEKQVWEDLPSETTPFNATRMTHIEDGIYENSIKTVTLDTEMSATSENGVENKVIKSYVDGKIKTEKTESDEASYSCNFINNLDFSLELSTAETKAGTFLGETLYSKVIPTSFNTNTTSYQTVATIPFKYLVFGLGFCQNGTSENNLIPTQQLEIYGDIGTGNINIKHSTTYWNNKPVWVIVFYTKKGE